jgi:hypothetical protein
MVPAMRIAGIAFAITLVASLTACSKDDGDGGSYARDQANANKPKNKGKPAEKIKTAVTAGKRVPCEVLFSPEPFTEALEEEEPVVISDETAKSKEASSICGIVRGGERPDAEAQKKMSEKNALLGVLPGDQICNVEVFCWEVPTAEQLKKNCSKKAEAGKADSATDVELGSVYACEQLRMQGPYDRFSYEAVDPETKCRVNVRGGPSMNDQAKTKTCAKIILDQLEADKLADFR